VNDKGGRLELQSNGGDAQITWTGSKVTVFDASSNTAYVADLPEQPKDSGSKDSGSPPSLDVVTKFLSDAAAHWSISTAQPSNVAGQEAYTVSVSPKRDGGLLGSAELAWDALRGTPLKVAVYARGDSSPVLALEVTDISFGSVSDSDVLVTPPAGAKVVDLSSQGHDSSRSGTASFPVVAPATLGGLARSEVQRAGDAAFVVYGDGPGSLVVVERKADGAATNGGPLGSLPSVKLDGLTAHELSTPLGTILTWDTGGISYVLAGSVPAATAESAARDLK
jgi:outer membrane lipoprotein-sorting protein